MRRAKSLIESFQPADLLPMPISVARLATMVSDPDGSVDDVARIIELEDDLTDCLLRLANSVWSGSRRQIVTVKEAVLRLGVAHVLKLAIARYITPSLGQPCRAYQLSRGELLRHSTTAALVAEHMGRVTKRHIPGIALAAALLHDVGKFVLSRHMDAEAVRRMRRMFRHDPAACLKAERTVLGTDHTEVGGLLMRHRQFPDRIVTAIRWHHDPDAKPDMVTDTVHIADAIARLVGNGPNEERVIIGSGPANRLGLTRTELETLRAAVMGELDGTNLSACRDDNVTSRPSSKTEQTSATR